MLARRRGPTMEDSLGGTKNGSSSTPLQIESIQCKLMHISNTKTLMLAHARTQHGGVSEEGKIGRRSTHLPIEVIKCKLRNDSKTKTLMLAHMPGPNMVGSEAAKIVRSSSPLQI